MPPRRFYKKKSFDSSNSTATPKTNGSSSAEQPQIQFDLGVEKKKVTVRKFKNMKLVDLREYYQKDGNWLPGSKGLSLTEDQWNVLVSKMVDISEALIKIDDKEEFNIMKAALERKNQMLKEEAEAKEETEEAELEADVADFGEDNNSSKTTENPKVEANNATVEEEEDEDIDDIEFEDVSEAPPSKRVKTE